MTEYDLLTSRLHYYVGKGFEVEAPIQSWYDRYQKGSPFTCTDWERFRDPRATTYASYTELQRRKEADVDALGHGASLSAEWLATLEPLLSPLRFPCHGLQMVAAYIGQMAPCGRITVAALFQTGDELRRVQRLAYRLRQVQDARPDFGQDGKARWQTDPMWQPLRELIERLLVTYDWGEAFTACNLVVKPLFDRVFLTDLGDLAATKGDPLLRDLFRSLNEDSDWHQAWSQELLRTAVADTPANLDTIGAWTEKWRPMAMHAMAPFVQAVRRRTM